MENRRETTSIAQENNVFKKEGQIQNHERNQGQY